MEVEAVIVSIVVSIIGISLICLGLFGLFGPVHVWYILRNPFMNLGLNTSIPGGLFFLFLALAFYLPPQSSLFVVNLGLLVGVVGTILMGNVPSFKPKWLQWLYQEHGDILELLRQEIWQDQSWNKRINTQEELELWVNQVRKKHGL